MFCLFCLDLAYNHDAESLLDLGNEDKPFYCIACQPPKRLRLLQEWTKQLPPLRPPVRRANRPCNTNTTLLDVKNIVLLLGENLPRTPNGQLMHRVIHSFRSLLQLSHYFNISLGILIMAKMDNNKAKYPVRLCLANRNLDSAAIDKYTIYSGSTGIQQDSDVPLIIPASSTTNLSECTEQFIRDLPLLSNEISDFAEERHWLSSYTWHYTSLSLSAEYGELTDALRDHPDSTVLPSLNTHAQTSILSELADVTIFLLHLARICDLRLPAGFRSVPP